jgi:hypothetical protein
MYAFHPHGALLVVTLIPRFLWDYYVLQEIHRKKVENAIKRNSVIQALQMTALFVGEAGMRKDGTGDTQQMGHAIILKHKQPHISYV